MQNRYTGLPLLRLNPRWRGSPGTISVTFSVDVNDNEDVQADRRQTDGTAIAYSEREREREFTFAKNRYIQLPLLRLNPSTEGFPFVNFPWMSTDGYRTKRRRKIAENFNRLCRVHERYRQTGDRQTERWRDSIWRTFTFAKNRYISLPLLRLNPRRRGFPSLGTISVKFSWMSTDGQGTKWRRKIAENFNQLSRVHERYRR